MTTQSIDARNLSVGDLYAFRHSGLQWRKVVRVRQTTMDVAGMTVAVTEVLHGVPDQPGKLLIANYGTGATVEIKGMIL